jgi:ComF family protein
MKVLEQLRDALLPAPCVVCGAEESGPLRLCAPCLEKMQLLSPCCPRCGVAQSAAEACLSCVARPPKISRRAIWRYDDAGAALMRMFKRRGGYALAGPLGDAAWRAGERASPPLHDWLAGVELVCAIPSHPFRRLARGYNPAGLLASEFTKAAQLPAPVALLRKRRLDGQTGRSGAQRRKIGRAFAAGWRWKLANGKRILLIDDVETTGATLRSAALELLRLGAKEVRALTIFRVTDER